MLSLNFTKVKKQRGEGSVHMAMMMAFQNNDSGAAEMNTWIHYMCTLPKFYTQILYRLRYKGETVYSKKAT